MMTRMIAILFLLSSWSGAHASRFNEDHERSSRLLKSFVSTPFVPTHQHSTMYLKRDIRAENPKILSLIEKGFLTYFLLILEEKKYKVSDQSLSVLESMDTYPSGSLSEYHRLIDFSRKINGVLPSRETTFFHIFRKPFSYFWPEIDMYDDMMRIRATFPHVADYLEYLFRIQADESVVRKVAEDLQKKALDSLSLEDFTLLFALHVFGHAEQRDLELAEKEVEKFKENKVLWPESMLKLVQECLRADQEKANRQAIKAQDEVGIGLYCFSDPEQEAEEWDDGVFDEVLERPN